ncbi:MAG: hypothetical protein WA474_18890 [Candidatus Sulfotelmatobacter sp.]
MNFAAELRRDLADRARKYASAQQVPHSLSYGALPVACFAPYADDLRHGNFLPESYQAIRANPAWKKRLAKVHTQGRRCLPATARGRWMELDACTSSDALLMNIFCYPGALRSRKLAALLAGEPQAHASFGYKARVPLLKAASDRTEVDLRWGDLLIEAKLTENDFQTARKEVLSDYRDFRDVFDSRRLPQSASHYFCYQLLRNVLAAHALQCSFCVLIDERRPDLKEPWYSVMMCVNPIELRTRLRIATWQEVAQVAPRKLQSFLAAKYGIGN